MKIAVSSTGKDLNCQIDPRFGRCACFLIVETDDMSFAAIENEFAGLSGGAGIQSARFVADKGARVVITGRCGPKAFQTLSAAGVNLIEGQAGTVRDVVSRFAGGGLTADSTTSPARPGGSFSRQNTAPAPGMPKMRGMGMGGGKGMETGKGMGRGKRGNGMGMGGGKGMGKPQR